jgi:DNA polymerase-3 subunit beta
LGKTPAVKKEHSYAKIRGPIEENMKFQADRDTLTDAISFVVRLISPRPQLPQLSGVVIESDGKEVTFSVFDYEVSAKATITANVEKPGKVLVQARLLSDIVSKLPSESVSIDHSEARVQIVSGSSKFSLSAMSMSEYPTTPSTPAGSGMVDGELFANAITQVSVAASKEEVTPVLTAVMISSNNKELSLIATDRFRVATRNIAWQGSGNDREILIPARVVGEIAKTFAHEKEITIGFADGDKEMVGFSSGTKTVTTSTIKGKYPAVLSLFPGDTPHFAVVNTHDLTSATKRVGLVVDRDKPLRFRFSSSEVVLESIGSDVADASEQVACSLTGEETTVSLKPQYLIDALAGIDTEMVSLGFTSNPNNPNKPGPVLITPVGSSQHYKYLLQPNLLVS